MTASHPSFPPGGPPGGSDAAILIVDDDPMVRAVCSSYLESAGFETLEAATLQEARDALTGGTLDLVLLDVVMPEGSGLDLCVWLRSQPAFEHLPVIVLTGLETDEIIDAAFESGATDFLRKPIEGPILTHRVRFALRASRALQALATSEASLSEAQRIARLGSFELDVVSRALCHTEGVAQVLALPPGSSCQSLDEALERVHPDDREHVRVTYRQASDDVSIDRLELMFRTLHAGTEGWCHARAVIERANDGTPTRMVGTLQDISQERYQQDRIEYLATHDRETGLLNHDGFLLRVEAALEGAGGSGRTLAVVQVSLDSFERVQTRLGSQRAARLLRAAADRLTGRTRPAGHRLRGCEANALGRCDGDAFSLLFDDAASTEEALQCAQKVVALLSAPFDLGEHEIGAVARAGVAIYPMDGTNAKDLHRSAEAARLSITRTDRDRVKRHEARITREAELRVQLEHDLRAAIQRDTLQLHFQPQVDRTGTIVTVETLARWNHPSHGWIAPDRFIPLAEESGMIEELGGWVIDHATDELGRWKRAGRRVRLAINLSPAQLDDPHLVATIQRAIERNGLSGDELEFEVTESLILGGDAAVIERLEAIKTTGARLALDDFGTGYSSLSYLAFLPLDVVKIDRSFINHLEGRGTLAVVRAIIALADSLSLTVVGEGVETEDQADLLLAEGCGMLQGYLYGRPMPAAELLPLLSPAAQQA